MGATDLEVIGMLGEKPTQDSNSFSVFADNWESFRVFFALRNQWQTAFKPNFTLHFFCIRAEAVLAVMQLLNIQDTERIFNDILVMEAAALPILNN